MDVIPKEWDLYRFVREIAERMEYLHNAKTIKRNKVRGLTYQWDAASTWDSSVASAGVDDMRHRPDSSNGHLLHPTI
ncbi:hypothetical protein AX14_001343 [Amanita brunnescens Koide BX004]|nr:hypothetical protein AX14_001343 [Amanita brunnescens Koide BX004]